MLLYLKKLIFFIKTFKKLGVGNVVKSISGFNLIISLINPDIAKIVFFLFKPITFEFEFSALATTYLASFSSLSNSNNLYN